MKPFIINNLNDLTFESLSKLRSNIIDSQRVSTCMPYRENEDKGGFEVFWAFRIFIF